MPSRRASSAGRSHTRCAAPSDASQAAGGDSAPEPLQATYRTGLHRRQALQAGASALVLKALLYLSAPPQAEAFNICTCQCCYSGICIDRPNSEEWNGTFQVPGCSFCTKSLCFEHIKRPIGSCDEVSATCVDYDTYWRLTVILLILFLLTSLLVIGCLRDIPVIKKVFKL